MDEEEEEEVSAAETGRLFEAPSRAWRDRRSQRLYAAEAKSKLSSPITPATSTVNTFRSYSLKLGTRSRSAVLTDAVLTLKVKVKGKGTQVKVIQLI